MAAPQPAAAAALVRPDILPDSIGKDIRSFFTSSTPPSSLPHLEASLTAFLAAVPSSTRIVCITSGGTTVPLEQNTVRFVDNFSTGQRGAAMAERFLERGYAVVFLHRSGSALPVLRRLPSIVATDASSGNSSSINSFAVLDVLNPASHDLKTSELSLPLKSSAASVNFNRLLTQYRSSRQLFLPLSFTSISEYLFSLRSVSSLLRARERNVIVLLAAAVSDYYIPPAQMSVHKLDSRAGGPLHLTMEQTPKVLHALRRCLPRTISHPEEPAWLPRAFLCSFKLETDASILVKKSRAAIEAYGVNAVLANELHTRYDELRIVHGKHSTPAGGGAVEADVELLRRRNPDPADAADADPFEHEIEVQLVERLIEMHTEWTKSQASRSEV